jgi:biotin-dependent carboxylase-like uncharacterized protein
MPHRGSPVLRIVATGTGATVQDGGRAGWRRYGLPKGGAMDRHAAEAANLLLDNPAQAPLLELLLHGAQFEMLQPAWIAITGAVDEASIPLWRAWQVAPGEMVRLKACSAGLWSYLAVAGGFAFETFFGSASYYARGQLGTSLAPNTSLKCAHSIQFGLPAGVRGRFWNSGQRIDYTAKQVIRVSPGPQWSSFQAADQQQFLAAEWKVSPLSDRVGYRLQGPALQPNPAEIISEPMQTIVMMRDGPTVGGYPKIAVIEFDDDLCRIAQTRPGGTIRFKMEGYE